MFIQFLLLFTVPVLAYNSRRSEEVVKGLSVSPSGVKAETIAFPDDLVLGRPKDTHQPYRTGPQHSYHYHHHHHGPNYHQHYDDPLEEIFGPPTNNPSYNHQNTGNGNPNRNNKSLEIPVDYIQNLITYNVSDLLLNFIEDDEDDRVSIQNRFGEDGERNAGNMPNPAVCMPELRTVKTVISEDPSILYIPQCTRVERCGGCCSHSLLECQPIETENLTYQVLKTQYTGGKKLKFVGKEVVLIEKHKKCKCDCKIKAKDCNIFQEYRQKECRCACKNRDEEKKCSKNFDKLWNPERCACECRDFSECSTGLQFDHNECKCKKPNVQRRFANQERERISEMLNIEGLYDGDY